MKEISLQMWNLQNNMRACNIILEMQNLLILCECDAQNNHKYPSPNYILSLTSSTWKMSWNIAKLDMCLWNTCPRQQQSQNMAKISKSYILTPPHPQGHEMSQRCEEPIDELTVQVWLLYHHPYFKYCTLFVSGTELRTDKQTDNPITRCPWQTCQTGGIKVI